MFNSYYNLVKRGFSHVYKINKYLILLLKITSDINYNMPY